MRTFAVLWRKEVAALFSSPIAYVVIAVFLLIMGYSFILKLFITHSQTLVDLFFQMFVLILLTVPIITMRLVAEENKLGTLEVLLTSPVTEPQIILAKFAASLTLVMLSWLRPASGPRGPRQEPPGRAPSFDRMWSMSCVTRAFGSCPYCSPRER
jgi:ABC-2 type transport system permease protein